MPMLAMLYESKTGCAFGFAVYALRAHPRYLAYYIYRLCLALGLVMVGWGQLGISFWLGSERVRWAIFEQVRPSETCPEASVNDGFCFTLIIWLRFTQHSLCRESN